MNGLKTAKECGFGPSPCLPRFSEITCPLQRAGGKSVCLAPGWELSTQERRKRKGCWPHTAYGLQGIQVPQKAMTVQDRMIHTQEPGKQGVGVSKLMAEGGGVPGVSDFQAEI